MKKRDKYFNPSKMLKQVLLVSGKKLNTATSPSVGLKLEPSGLQKHHEIVGKGMDIFALGCNTYTCRMGRHVGRQAFLHSVVVVLEFGNYPDMFNKCSHCTACSPDSKIHLGLLLS